MDTKSKIKNRMNEIRFITEHTLDKDQFKKLVEKKMARAKLYSDSLKKREALIRSR